ncbi:MAG: F0F1 ATP synthase subunit A [Desulfobacterales bacterium]|nr:F0F1 ATP synthase subunit A [Desulfobacterales bacterium]MCP4164042.1 F0F1 ATP synthase subunit A [Deltaproteobacteria bacterium]
MEHPYLYFVKLLDLLHIEALSHFIHGYVHVFYMWVIMIFLIILGAIAGKKPQLVPKKVQNVFELLIGGLEEFMVEMTGEEGRWFFPLAGTIFLFVFVANLSGLLPGFYPPTAALQTTLALAICSFTFTHFLGIKHHGAKYYKHFMGPVWWLAPLICPIEIIGHLARIMSLSFRLFGNMMGHELVLGILFFLAGGFFVPLPIMAMGIFVAFVQAFVFFLLSVLYFQGAMDHAH